MVTPLKFQPLVTHVNINGTIMVKSVSEILDVTIPACSQGTVQGIFIFCWPSTLKCFINTMSSRQAVLCDWTSSWMDRSRKSNSHFEKILFQPWICSNWRQYRSENCSMLVLNFLPKISISEKSWNQQVGLSWMFRSLSASIIIECCLQGLFRQLQWQGSWKCQL